MATKTKKEIQEELDLTSQKLVKQTKTVIDLNNRIKELGEFNVKLAEDNAAAMIEIEALKLDLARLLMVINAIREIVAKLKKPKWWNALKVIRQIIKEIKSVLDILKRKEERF